MSTTEQMTMPWYRRLVQFVFLRLFPMILLLAILFSAVQVITAFWTRYSDYNLTVSRQADYVGTATALAPSDQSSFVDAPQLVAQFATNTPSGNDAGSQVFPTNTPEPNSPIVTPTFAPLEPIALPTFFLPVDGSGQEIAGMMVPPRAQTVPRDYNLINIVLLGGDDEITNDNTVRTDTMIVVSVNLDTSSVSMINLPRDLFVYVPTPTMTRLNTVYGIGESFGWSGGGFGLLRETIFYNFGIQVHYYARVNISGLASIIDTLGGIELAVDCAYVDYAIIGAEVPQIAGDPDDTGLYVLPVGYYHFSGPESLWYARTRGNSDDFDRGRRQQNILRAIFRAGRDNGQIAQVPQLWGEITTVVETDIPFDVVLRMLPIALNLETNQIRSFGLIRTYHTTPWQPPTGAFEGQSVQLLNAERVYQLLYDFYQPPTESQLDMAGPSIVIYNGTNQPDWDLVAVERLRALGLNAYAGGFADRQDYAATTLIDYSGQDKGSPVRVLIEQLNLSRENITIEPNPQRTADYQITLGNTYNSCAGSVVEN